MMDIIKKLKNHKTKANALLLLEILGLPFIFWIFIIIIGIVLIFGLTFLYKNIIWISIFIGGLYVLNTLAKQRRISGKEFIGFFVIMLTFTLFGGYFGMLAVGMAQPKYSIEISTGNSLPMFDAYGNPIYYGNYMYHEELKPSTSFLCESPFAESLGCRIGPGTYRPLEIKICNKDPELPLPPSIVLIRVDPKVSLRPGQEFTFAQIGYRGQVPDLFIPDKGDVFIAQGKKDSWYNTVLNWMMGRSSLTNSAGTKTAVLYLTEPIEPGQCVELGKDINNEPTLFIVADRHAKINTRHTIEVSLVEITTSDNILRMREQAITGIGQFISERVPVVGKFFGEVFSTVVAIITMPVQMFANLFSVTSPRVVYTTAAYNFIVAYPIVEILVILGAVGVLSIIVTKFIFKWW